MDKQECEWCKGEINVEDLRDGIVAMLNEAELTFKPISERDLLLWLQSEKRLLDESLAVIVRRLIGLELERYKQCFYEAC